MQPKVSICMASIRPQLWSNMYNSLLSNEIEWEMIMVGPNEGALPGPRSRFIYSTVKPSQCYSIAFSEAKGELISWSADDAIYSPKALDEMYLQYSLCNDSRVVMSLRTIEDGRDITEVHRFIGRNYDSPRMAPFGVVNRELFLSLGGYDRNFLCGQSENDVVMRFLEIGGHVEVCPTASAIVDHYGAHYSGTVFRTNNYHIDRAVLEAAWLRDGVVSQTRLKPVESFSPENILTITQAQNGGQWR